MTDGKLQVGIYKIEEEFIKIISSSILKKGYKKQELDEDTISGYRIELYYINKTLEPKWKDFLNSITKEDQLILKSKQSRTEGFILLLFDVSKNNLYALIGGIGYFAIQDYIYEDFGIDIFSRLIKKEDKVIKATREKSVVGGILGSTKHFRKDFNLHETDSFGKIYQELKASLDKKLLVNYLGFSADDIRKDSACIAKSSFKINKAITFDQLLEVVIGCEKIIENIDPIPINDVKKINKKKNKDLIERLEKNLYDQLWDRFIAENRTGHFTFDLCHKDVEKYLTASEYIIYKGHSQKNYFDDFIFEELTDIDDIFEQILKTPHIAKNLESKEEFIEILKSLKIYSYDEERNTLTRGDLSSHILGDVTLLPDDKKYFFIDKSWYLIKDDFLKNLDQNCKEFLTQNYVEGLCKHWDYPNESENQYNQKYIGEENTIVLDKITPENM